jgi:hypothetical protein
MIQGSIALFGETCLERELNVVWTCRSFNCKAVILRISSFFMGTFCTIELKSPLPKFMPGNEGYETVPKFCCLLLA